MCDRCRAEHAAFHYALNDAERELNLVYIQRRALGRFFGALRRSFNVNALAVGPLTLWLLGALDRGQRLADDELEDATLRNVPKSLR